MNTALSEDTALKPLPPKSVKWLSGLNLSLLDPNVEPAKSLCASVSGISTRLEAPLKELHGILSSLQTQAKQDGKDMRVSASERPLLVTGVQTMSNVLVASRKYDGKGLSAPDRHRLAQLKKTLETSVGEVWQVANALSENPMELQASSLPSFGRKR